MRSCCAVYVDVGYLLAAAATRVTGSSLRRGVQTDYASLISWLCEHAEADSGLPLLRVNWYDAGGRPGGMPDASQDEIGTLPQVKLRLGRLSYSGEQKGVDVRIGLDLAIQARQRVADVVYLVSGDDDLTEAVEDAQSHGVQVVLLAVPRHDERPLAVSKHLLREVDRTQIIAQDAIDRAFKPTAIPEALIPSPAGDDEAHHSEQADQTSGDADSSTSGGAETHPTSTTSAESADGSTTDGAAGSAMHRERRRTVRIHSEHDGEDASETPDATPATPGSVPTPAHVAGAPVSGTAAATPSPRPTPGARPAPAVPSPAILARRKASSVALPGTPAVPIDGTTDEHGSLAMIDAVARQVVAAWCSSATIDALAALKAAAPVIPSELDRALLVDLSSRYDEHDLDDDTRHRVRERFWFHIGRVRPV